MGEAKYGMANPSKHVNKEQSNADLGQTIARGVSIEEKGWRDPASTFTKPWPTTAWRHIAGAPFVIAMTNADEGM
jgi:hypothetical protein